VALVVGLRRSGDRPFLAWAAAAIAADALYWHHGIQLGPRMLYESVPAWVALSVAAAVGLTTADVVPPRLRRPVGWAIAASVLGAPLLTSTVARAASLPTEDPVLTELLRPDADGPKLVFAHGSWSSRVVARLSAVGMRRDSVETALRRNDLCSVDRYARWREAGPTGAAPALDLEPLPGTPEGLVRVRLSTGNDAWADTAIPWDPECLHEAAADALGTIELEALAWRAPPLSGRQVVIARDMGPATNARVRETMGTRRTFVYVAGNGAAPSRMLPYDDGIRRLWGEGP